MLRAISETATNLKEITTPWLTQMALKLSPMLYPQLAIDEHGQCTLRYGAEDVGGKMHRGCLVIFGGTE